MDKNSQPVTPEILTPRLGDYLVAENFITRKQLEEALEAQKEFRRLNPGVHAPLVGEILVERGYVEKAVVDHGVTELIMRLKNALERSNEQLEERVKERTKELEFALNKINLLNSHKSEFVSNMSHELLTPMTHIIGYTYLFLDGTFGDLDEEQMDAMTVIKDAVDRLEQLINDLISFTEIDQGELLLQRSLADPEAICQKAVQANQKSAEEKKIHIIQECEEGLPDLNIDAERILWVLREFLSNAIKFSAKKSDVVVKAKREDNTIEFSVTDSGIGIPEDKLDVIFEPFLQLDGSITRSVGGTGIGLTICKEIVEAHDSSILVKSTVDKGTEFSFKILIPEKN